MVVDRYGLHELRRRRATFRLPQVCHGAFLSGGRHPGDGAAIPHFSGILSYGYSWTLYEAAQEEFSTCFGEPVLSYHPPHDRVIKSTPFSTFWRRVRR
ncbi:MAG: hypothetical protein P8X82_14865 [Gemmatimonadales bacterium]|jgi:hypothetical protein